MADHTERIRELLLRARDLEAEATGLRAVAGRLIRGEIETVRSHPRPGLFHVGRGRVAAGLSFPRMDRPVYHGIRSHTEQPCYVFKYSSGRQGLQAGPASSAGSLVRLTGFEPSAFIT